MSDMACMDTDKPGHKNALDLSVFIREFEVKRQEGFAAAEQYLTNHPEIAEAVRETLYMDVVSGTLSASLLEWLYNCAVSRGHSKPLFTFVLQFIPDLMYVYLHSVVENAQQLKVPTEALLLGIVKEVEHKKPTHTRTHSLSRPSVYHQSTTRVTQPSLTEAALIRHNQTEAAATANKATFSDTEVNGSNRLAFLTAVVDAFSNSITAYLPSSLIAFCNNCTRLAVQGMHAPFLAHFIKEHSSGDGCLTADTLTRLSKKRRLPTSDGLLASLLHSLRICLFQSCHSSALQALHAMKMRAEYEELPVSLQVSCAMLRINDKVTPFKLPLDPSQHMMYSDKGQTNWTCRPVTVMRSLLGQVLHSRLDSTKITTSTNLYCDVGAELASVRNDSVLEASGKESNFQSDEEEDEEEEEEDEGAYLTPTEVNIEFSIGGTTSSLNEEELDTLTNTLTSESVKTIQAEARKDVVDQFTGYTESLV